MKMDMRGFRRRPLLVLGLISLALSIVISIMSDCSAIAVEGMSEVEEKAEVKAEVEEKVEEKEEVKVEEKAEEKAEVSKEEVKVEEKAEVEAPTAVLRIKEVKIGKVGKLTRAEIITSGEPVSYKVYTLDAPPRVVAEIGNVGEIPAKKEIRAVSPHIKGARLGRYDGHGKIVFDSRVKDLPYEVVKGRDRVVIFFGRKPAVAAAKVEDKVEEKAEEAAEVKVEVEEKAEEAAPAEEKAKEEVTAELPGKTLSILGVKIRKEGKLTKAEIVASGDIVTYNAFSLKAPNRLVVDIGDAREISAKKEIRAVSPHIKGARAGRYDGHVRVVFDYKGGIIPYEVTKGKDRVIIFFGKDPAVTIAEVEEKAEAPKEKVKAEVEEKVEEKEEVKAETEAEVPKEEVKAEAEVETKEEVEEEAKAGGKAEVKETAKPAVEEAPIEYGAKFYKGQKVTLEFKDADIKNIFRVIAEVSEYNMIIDPAVTGKLTLRLKNVPWDQALDLILETNDLGMTKVGNVIRIVPSATIKKEEEDKIAAKKTVEKFEDLLTKLIPVSYAKASDIKMRLESIKTERGKVDVDDRTNMIIMTDVQKSIDDAVKLVASLDTPTTQIMIEARIVEATTDFTRNLGVQWGTGHTADASHGNPTGYYFPNSYAINAGGGGSYALAPPAAGAVGPAGGAIGISFGSINNTLSLDLRLSALETQGWGKIVSSPKVLTLDNKEASIQQGVQIPYQTTSSTGTQTQFVPATLSLNVTPHATADGRINLKIKVNKDSADRSTTPPSINTNQATTEILVKDGETTVIGGIYSTTKTEGETYTPFLGRIPLIGWLFKSKSVSDNKTELLIFITPRVVRDRPA